MTRREYIDPRDIPPDEASGPGEPDLWLASGFAAVALAVLLGLLQIPADSWDRWANGAATSAAMAFPIAVAATVILRSAEKDRHGYAWLPFKNLQRSWSLTETAGGLDLLAVGFVIAHLNVRAAIAYIVCALGSVVLVFHSQRVADRMSDPERDDPERDSDVTQNVEREGGPMGNDENTKPQLDGQIAE